MPLKQHGRQYDIVVLGASGYTGLLTAEHIAVHLPTDLRWAVAGRTQGKLQNVINHCNQANPDRAPPVIELADVSNVEQLEALAKKTYILITCVGPYCIYGEKVFKACAENGTHYFDCTGEFPWVGSMIKKYEKSAQASGALMFPQFGIESCPPDVCTWALAKHVREEFGAPTKDVTMNIQELIAAPSGGTLQTVFSIFDYFSLNEIRAAGKPYALSPVPRQGEGRPRQSFMNNLLGSRTVPDLGTVTTSIAHVTDAAVVERSWGLLSQIPSRKNEFYGSKFTWMEYMAPDNFLKGIAMHWGLLLGGFFVACLPPLRWLLKKLVYQPGDGPKLDSTHSDEIQYHGVARPDKQNERNQRAFVKGVFRGGSMYYLTGLLLAQGSLTLLEEDTHLDGGVYTGACLGQPFIDRASKAGFTVEVKTLEG